MKKIKYHILVVDDDNRIRELVKEYLNENDFIVSTGNNAEEAKIKLGYFKFDLIVLDVMMPGQNGFELTKEIKKIPVKRLDNLVELKNIERPSILKLDVQGYEFEVLKGLGEFINYIDYIVTEVSFTEIYEDQVMENKLIDFIQSKSFILNKKCNLSRMGNKLFQEDVLFARKN